MVWFAIAAAAIAIGTQIIGARQARKANERNQQAAAEEAAARREQARIERLKLARQRRAVAREARLARGTALAAGGLSGASVLSSGIAGGIGGAESVATSSQQFLSESERGAAEIGRRQGEAISLGLSADRIRQRGQNIVAIGSSASQIIGGFGSA